MKRIYISLALALACLGAEAVTIECSPGELRNLVTEPETLSSLKINGTVDASDLFYIASEMKSLRELDMSAVTISAYSGEALNHISSYNANTIPAGVFMDAPFTTVVLPASEGLVIGEAAFAASAVTGITVPANVGELGQAIFAACKDLKEATLHVSAGDYMFDACSALERVNLGNVSSIGTAAFKDCITLNEISGAANISSIGSSAFQGDVSLKGFYMGEALENIGARAFSGSGMQSAPLAQASNLRNVGDWAFEGCRDLRSASLPAGVSTVGDGCFAHCPQLASVNYQSDQIPPFVFKGTAVAGELSIPAGVKSIGAYSLANVDGVDTLILPSSLEYIGDGAMEMMQGLKTIDVQTFTVVPELGEDVWLGVDQPSVTVKIPHDLKEGFENADQWKYFSLWPVNSINDEFVIDSRRLSAAFDGMTLLLRSQGTDISSVEIYNDGGLLLYRSAVNADNAAIDTSAMSGNIFIVKCIVDNGSTALKMFRK